MMFHTGKKIPSVAHPQDPDETRKYTIILRPAVWEPEKVYYENESAVIPTAFNGFYYIPVSGGVSGAIEPDLPCQKDEEVDDACVRWKAVPYDLLLRPGANITSAAWACDVSAVAISQEQHTNDAASALISDIPSDVKKILITVSIEYGTAGESVDRSFYISVKQL